MSKDSVLFSTIFNNLDLFICSYINIIANTSNVLANFYEKKDEFIPYNCAIDRFNINIYVLIQINS